MPNPYVNKVVQSNGTTLIDISDTTAVAADVASGKYFYTASGEKVEGTASGGGDEPSGPTYVNVVPEQTFTPTNDYTLLTSTEALVAGEKYRYIVNGVEKTGTAAEFYGSVILGNYSDYSGGTGGAFESLNGVIYYDTKFRTAQTVQVDRVVEGSGGGASSWTKIAETSYQVSTTSTTATTVATLATGSSDLWTSSKWVYVRIRDTAGKREGYYYGCDQFFYNIALINGTSSTYITTARNVTTCYSASGFSASEGNVGIFADRLYSNGDLRIRARYNSSSTLTINGTYKVEVYLLDPPAGTPIFE